MTAVIGILMPGDMGHGVGTVLAQAGHRIVTCLAGRSDHSRTFAARAGMEDAGSLPDLVQQADLILSILPPSAAIGLAEDVAAAMVETGKPVAYADCNAIAPATARQVGDLIIAAGAPFIDAGIIGAAPNKSSGTRFYVSGPDTSAMEALNSEAIKIVPLGPEIGRASAMKMVYAALTKGTWTLQTAVLMAAERLGLTGELIAEFENSQKPALAAMRQRVPRLPADAARWIGEMEEIAATFADAGVTPDFHNGAADIFRILAQTPFAQETRETFDPNRTLEEALRVYAAVEPDAGD